MITAIGDVMRECYARGWITTRDGNASLRRKDSNCVYITPSGVRKNKIEVESIIKMKIQGNELVLPNGAKPSGELHMHWRLLENARTTRAILHVHPTHIIAAMHAGWDLQVLAKQFPEVSRYTKVGPNVPVLPVTSKELGEATWRAMCKGSPNLIRAGNTDCVMFDIVGQDRHGICAVAGDPWSAFEHVERLEHICEIVLKSGVKP